VERKMKKDGKEIRKTVLSKRIEKE